MLSQDEQTRPTGSQAIERAAQLLVLVLEQDQPTTLGELARLTDLPKSTASRLVAALERNALVQRDSARGAIRPGPAVLRFAQRGVDDADLTELAHPVLHALAAESGETINLAVPAMTGVNHLAQVDSRHMIGAASWVGRAAPFHAARERQGLPRLRHRRAPAHPADPFHAAHDHRPRRTSKARSTRSARSATRRRSTRSRSVSRPSPPPSAAPPAPASPLFPSPARASVSMHRGSTNWVRCSSSRPPSSPPDSGTPTLERG